jgi:superoxide dismutase, Fe-Mn family
MKKILFNGFVFSLFTLFVLPMIHASEVTDTNQTQNNAQVQLPELPFETDAFEPFISARTIDIHYGKHHAGYVKKTNALIAETPYAGMDLLSIIKASAARPAQKNIFNNSAQVWNHTFFWNSLSADGGGIPTGDLKKMIDESFGSYENFRQLFVTVATSHFGSGWVWLVQDGGLLRVFSTPDAYTPITEGLNPLIVLDVWEHAYYLDHQNRRKEFVEIFLDKLLNWEFARVNLSE